MQVSGRQEASLRLGTSLPPTRGLALSYDLVFKTLCTRQLHLLSDLIKSVCYRYPPIEVVQVRNLNILPADVSSK